MFDKCFSFREWSDREHSPEGGGKITVWLVSSLAILDLTKDEHGLLFVCSETVESNLVKLEMRCTVILTLQ